MDPIWVSAQLGRQESERIRQMGARAGRLRRSGASCVNSLKSRYRIDKGTHQHRQKCHRHNKAYRSEAAHFRLAFGNPGLILRIVFAQELPSIFNGSPV